MPRIIKFIVSNFTVGLSVAVLK